MLGDGRIAEQRVVNRSVLKAHGACRLPCADGFHLGIDAVHGVARMKRFFGGFGRILAEADGVVGEAVAFEVGLHGEDVGDVEDVAELVKLYAACLHVPVGVRVIYLKKLCRELGSLSDVVAEMGEVVVVGDVIGDQ